MGVLEEITQLKSQGIPEQDIINSLQQKGISPKEINDALSQSQIKNAVSNTENTEGMQPSVMNKTPQTRQQFPQGQNLHVPKTKEIRDSQEQELYAPQPQESYQPQEFYQQDAYDYPSAGADTNTMIEVAEQVFSEKIGKIQKQIEEINEFKTLAQTKINDTLERLQRIEATIDKLQLAILDKVGSYGKNLEGIKKEMSMMQDSFGKVVNQAVRGHATQSTSPRKTAPVAKKTTRKNISKKV